MPYETLQNQKENLIKTPGVYLFEDARGEIIYIGKSINVRERVNSHIHAVGTKSQTITQEAVTIRAIPVFSELEALLLEAVLIKKHLPRYNAAARDDKHPLYIKITTRDEFPKITTARKEDDPKARYFGPFPSSSTVKSVLRQIRKVFPYCAQKRVGKNACFYAHIGLCGPCPSEIAQIADPEEKLRQIALYKSNIRKIVTLLSGKTKRLEKQLLGDMKAAVLSQNFEEAARIRDQQRQMAYITRPYQKTQAYLENPNLVADIRQGELKTLRDVLSPYYSLPPTISRLECYDVAHTGGEATTCSLVTFVGGEPEKNLYRRFKIKHVNQIDDYASLQETLKRRLNHLDDWGKPDIIVVDGGKGQVSATQQVLKEHGISIPLIGLAKRLEEIVIPLPDGDFKVLLLGKGNPGVKLLQRMRDEAHRFARSYHFKLRLKELLPSQS